MSHRIAIACLIALLSSVFAPFGPAHGDPTIQMPPAGRGVLRRGPEGEPRLWLVGDLSVLGIMATGDAAEYPELGAIDAFGVALASARVGMLGGCGALYYGVRVDLSEALRATADDFDERPIATLARFVDDAALWWRPRQWAAFELGRLRVPLSRFRQLERARLTGFATPQVIDRLAPDRRFGAALTGDVGAMAYAGGVYADSDALEVRRADDPDADPALPTDPSASGRALVAGYVWWTPRAPIGADHMATPSSDPWYGTLRPAAGLGLAWRERAGANRLDVSLAIQLAYRRYAVITEFLAYSDGREFGLGGALTASALASDRAVIYAVAEYDSQLALWSAGAGAALFVTRDRMNKIGVVGSLGRNTRGGPDRDAVLLQLQTAL